MGYVGFFQLDCDRHGEYIVDKWEVMPRTTGVGLPTLRSRIGPA